MTASQSMSRALSLLVATVLVATPWVDARAAEPSEMTLAQALEAATANSPVLRAAESEVEAARGRLAGARTYRYNPELELEGADRTGPAGSSTDRELGLSQQIEIGGQRGKREAAGSVDVAAAERRLERRRQEVAAAVEQTFARAIGARELVQIAGADLALTRHLLDFQQRRLEAGAGTQLELNLARAGSGRAERRLQEATAAWLVSRARLAEAAGLDPRSPPLPIGSLPRTPPEIPPLEDLIADALSRRPDLESARQEQELARRLLELERSLSVPDLRVGAFARKEEDDDIAGVGLGLAIPLFSRNQGGIAEARAGIDRGAAATRAAELLVRREVTEGRARLEAAAAALAALDELVVGTLEESLELLQGAMEAGKVSATEVLLLRRELVEGRREHVEAALEAWVTRVELELALGRSGNPKPGKEKDDAR
jgi:cobalt-zinc-cadmium efflux system outer membrane protein